MWKNAKRQFITFPHSFYSHFHPYICQITDIIFSWSHTLSILPVDVVWVLKVPQVKCGPYRYYIMIDSWFLIHRIRPLVYEVWYCIFKPWLESQSLHFISDKSSNHICTPGKLLHERNASRRLVYHDFYTVLLYKG